MVDVFLELTEIIINVAFAEDASSSDEELKQINRELSPKKFTSQLNSVTSGRNTGGGNRHLLGIVKLI